MAKVLYPGSFDPIHLGHVDIIDQAARLFGHVVTTIAGVIIPRLCRKRRDRKHRVNVRWFGKHACPLSWGQYGTARGAKPDIYLTFGVAA
mgnify:CR=1 FL=1